MARGEKPGRHPPVAGPRANALSILSIGLLVTFVAVIILLVIADLAYLGRKDFSPGQLWDILMRPQVLGAIRLSLITSVITLVLIVLTAVPIGYALSRYRFWGHTVVNTIVDLPIVLPPIIMGISLLVLFGSGPGRAFQDTLYDATGWRLTSAIGIVMCQYLVSVSYSIRMCKASFDTVDQQLEHVAMTLGCSPWQAFWRIAIPLAGTGLVAGSVVGWARAVGVFGPIMVFVGTMSHVRVMPTAIWLELSTGQIEVSIAMALVMLLMAGIALAVVHWLAPGRKWM